MRILIDMNLSPEWQPILQKQGFEAIHWSSVGAGNGPGHRNYAVGTRQPLRCTLRAHAEALESGALITIDESKSRVRILPI